MIIPWHGRISLPAVYGAGKVIGIYAPYGAIVEGIEIREKMGTKSGQNLIRLYNPDLEYELAQSKRQVHSLTTQVDVGTISESFSERRTYLFEELQRAISELEGLEKQIAKQTIKAPIPGTIVDFSLDVKKGEWVAAGEPLFSIRGHGKPVIEAYITEKDLHRLEVGATALFTPENPEQDTLNAQVVTINRTASRSLNKPYLASHYGGPIAVRPSEGAMIPEQALYHVKLEVEDSISSPTIEMRGTVHITAPAESLAAELWRSVTVVLLREGGF